MVSSVNGSVSSSLLIRRYRALTVPPSRMSWRTLSSLKASELRSGQAFRSGVDEAAVALAEQTRVAPNVAAARQAPGGGRLGRVFMAVPPDIWMSGGE
jgi:hypothetical protein